MEKGIRFVRNMILARLLTPTQFGQMAIILAVSTFFDALTEVGVRQAIVQNPKGDTREFLNVAWWVSALRGALLLVIGFIIAPLVGRFYQDPALNPLLRVVFLSVLFTGLTSPRMILFERRFQFGKYVAIAQTASFGGVLISLIAAACLRNTWALVLGVVAESGFRCGISFLIAPIKPRFSVDPACTRELLGFARGMLGLPLLTCFVMQVDVFVLGRICPKEQLGMYSLAIMLACMPLAVFARGAQPMILPILSRVQGEPARLESALLSICQSVFTLVIPMTVCLVLFARPLLAVVYGMAYTSMADTFRVLCVYFGIYVASTIPVSTYLAIGRPELQRRFMALWAFLLLLAIYPASRYGGTLGAAGALIACLSVASAVQLLRLRKLLSLSLRAYVATSREGLVLGVIAVIMAVPALSRQWSSNAYYILYLGALCSTLWAGAAIRWWAFRIGREVSSCEADA